MKMLSLLLLSLLITINIKTNSSGNTRQLGSCSNLQIEHNIEIYKRAQRIGQGTSFFIT